MSFPEDDLRSGATHTAQPCLNEPRHRLIVALDFPSAREAFDLVERLEGSVQWFKVGLELYLKEGPKVVEALVQRGSSVFLDLKLYDIPNTVAAAVRSVSSLGVGLLTVHASGGHAMLAAAQEAAALADLPLQLLAVTVVTSMDQPQLVSIGIERSAADQVSLLAATAQQAGISGFVCSPHEARSLRSQMGPDARLVIPGIRPAGAAAGDQKRAATPAFALREGASQLVVGRPITQAPDPVAAAAAILKEIAEA